MKLFNIFGFSCEKEFEYKADAISYANVLVHELAEEWLRFRDSLNDEDKMPEEFTDDIEVKFIQNNWNESNPARVVFNILRSNCIKIEEAP